jgi:hypothetical protein
MIEIREEIAFETNRRNTYVDNISSENAFTNF